MVPSQAPEAAMVAAFLPLSFTILSPNQGQAKSRGIGIMDNPSDAPWLEHQVDRVFSGYIAFFGAVSVLPARSVVPVKEMQGGARVQIQAIACLKSW
jgi:hypothetical protein